GSCSRPPAAQVKAARRRSSVCVAIPFCQSGTAPEGAWSVPAQHPVSLHQRLRPRRHLPCFEAFAATRWSCWVGLVAIAGASCRPNQRVGVVLHGVVSEGLGALQRMPASSCTAREREGLV